MSDKKYLNHSYKDFELLSVKEIPDCKSIGIYLRHKKTGLDVYHLLNDESENLFAFCFRTPLKNSTGAAHILEHSVLCGSQKFPLKEPFTNLMNQSVNTFLNALTYPDKTVYPASSTSSSDYFNLMNVYGDAVFFPLLREESFLQEACRVELNDKGEYELQGVVYNEMKGSYSSFDSVAADVQIRSLFKDTVYEYDSGGDPLEIPNFTYQDFKDFHSKYYKPDNCLVFLSGNIETEKQLDFIQENFINRMNIDSTKQVSLSKLPIVNKDFLQIETPKLFQEPIKVSDIAPDSGATGITATMNWLSGKTEDLQSFIDCTFLCEVLAGDESSPLLKALLDSKLGDDVASYSGISNSFRMFITSFGLSGVAKKNVQKVYDLINSTLNEIYVNGVSEDDIKAALLSVEFYNREIVRGSGPYSLVMLDRVLNSWNYGEDLSNALLYINAFDNIKQRLKEDKDLIKKLLKKYFLDNKSLSYVEVTPSSLYLKTREQKEKELLEKITKNINKEEVQKKLDKLHAYQEHHESAEEINCIPFLRPSDLNKELDELQTTYTEYDNGNGKKVLVFNNIVETNGIGYFNVMYPVDKLSPLDYLYLPLFSYCSLNSGWNNKSWAECSKQVAITSGGISAKVASLGITDKNKNDSVPQNIKDTNCIDRDWITYSTKFTVEKTKQALDLFAEAITKADYKDLNKLKSLIKEARSSLRSTILPRGNRYALSRSRSGLSHFSTVNELFTGLSQLFFLEKVYKKSPKQMALKFNNIDNVIKSCGGIIYFTADKETTLKIQENLPSFIKELNLQPVQKQQRYDEKEFTKALSIKNKPIGNEYFLSKTQVGYVSCNLPSSEYATKESSADLVFAHWISGTFLWDKIRVKGGAYGAYAMSNSYHNMYSVATYRDPNPLKSLDVIKEVLEEALNCQLTKDECDRLITGTYSDEYQPLSPSARGKSSFLRVLSCITDEDRRNNLSRLLNITCEDLKESAERLLNNYESAKVSVIGDNSIKKSIKNASVIIKLPL